MIVSLDFESTIVAAHTPTYMQLEDAGDYVEVSFNGDFIEPVVFKLVTFDGKVTINIHELTKQIYSKIDSYKDPFDYTETVEYYPEDKYHIGELNLTITDSEDETIERNLTVLNSALQVNECIVSAFYINKRLGNFCQSEVLLDDDYIGFNYDLNFDLHL